MIFAAVIPLLILVVTNIHVWQYNNSVSRNNTLIQAQNHIRNKTSTDPALRTFTSNHQYATCMSTNLTQVFSHLAKAYDVINHGMLLQKLLSWHKRYIKLVVKNISIAHKYLNYNVPNYNVSLECGVVSPLPNPQAVHDSTAYINKAYLNRIRISPCK
jgi:hypothetical protein